jgi:hypothetical protein
MTKDGFSGNGNENATRLHDVINIITINRIEPSQLLCPGI